MTEVSSKLGYKVTIGAEHRDGQGNLIVRTVTLDPPNPPNCSKPRCLWEFFWETVFYSLVSTYHSRRIRYAERKRYKKIPLKYRTGESPENILQAIFALIALKLRR